MHNSTKGAKPAWDEQGLPSIIRLGDSFGDWRDERAPNPEIQDGNQTGGTCDRSVSSIASFAESAEYKWYRYQLNTCGGYFGKQRSTPGQGNAPLTMPPMSNPRLLVWPDFSVVDNLHS